MQPPSPTIHAALGRARRSDGFTLVEVLVAIAVLAVAIGLTVAAISSLSTFGGTSRETSLAQAALFEKVEELRARPLAEVFAAYNDSVADDDVDPRGAHFDVPGLAPREDDADGRVGRVVLPVDAAAPTTLREDLDLPWLGTPLDLDLDAAVDGADHAANYRILPVQVVVEWRGRTGNRRITAETTLGGW